MNVHIKNKKILISGSGVAGLSLAYWLQKYGFSPTIIEKAPALRIGGFKIDIRGVAVEVLKRMGIYSNTIALKTDIKEALIVDSDGKPVTEMDSDTYDIRISEDLEILRGDLCNIIKEKLNDVEFIFGDSIKMISQKSEGVYVEFQQAQPQFFDIVIGADGLHSIVRKLTFGDESNFTRELGLYISIFSVPNYLNLDRKIIECTESGKIAILYCSKNDCDAKAAFLFSSKDLHVSYNDIVQQKKLISSVYANTGWEIPRILRAMDDAGDFYFDFVAQVHMNCWSKDRVVLVGDAGYCASPVSGQGTSIALVGAYVLAGELAAASGDYKKAFTLYENAMRSYVEKNQKFGRIFANDMTGKNKNKFIIWINNKFIKILPGKWINFITKRRVDQVTRAANALKLKDYH